MPFDDMIMKPIFKRVTIRKLMSFDTEDDTHGNIIIGNIFDGEKNYWYETQDEFMDHIRDISNKYGKQRVYLVATNLEYDMINSFKGYYNRIDLMYAGRLINFKVKDSNIYGMDSLNHYKDGIKAQGERLGMNKLKVDVKNLKKDSIENVKSYNAQDTKICLAAMDLHQKSINTFGGELRDTAAGTALNLFRRKFLHQNIRRPEDEDLEFMKQGYYGGRVEIFNMELRSDDKYKIRYYDINSLYPDVMLNNSFPDPNTIYHGKSIEAEGVSEVEIEYLKPESVYIPYLPYKYAFKKNGSIRLMFPVGKLYGTWSNFELRYAINHNLIRINKLIRSVNFEKSEYYFKDYMEYMYAERKRYKQGKDLLSVYMSNTTKLYMNSLYGKFFEHVDSDATTCDSDGIISIEPKENYWPAHSNGIWSLMTTAYARTKEYEGLKKIVDKGGQLGYCDTDCAVYKGNDGILTVSNEIGDFKQEGTYKYARFYLPKTYLLVDENNEAFITAKGIPSNNSPEDEGAYYFIKEGFGGNMEDPLKINKKYKYKLEFLKNGKTTVKAPVRFKESFRSIKYKNKPNVWRDKEKYMKALYLKRVVLKNGDTRPFIMMDDKLV